MSAPGTRLASPGEGLARIWPAMRASQCRSSYNVRREGSRGGGACERELEVARVQNCERWRGRIEDKRYTFPSFHDNISNYCPSYLCEFHHPASNQSNEQRYNEGGDFQREERHSKQLVAMGTKITFGNLHSCHFFLFRRHIPPSFGCR